MLRGFQVINLLYIAAPAGPARFVTPCGLQLVCRWRWVEARVSYLWIDALWVYE